MSNDQKKKSPSDDNERATELISIMKKYWKLEDVADKNANETASDGVSDVSDVGDVGDEPETPEYDGIIAEQSAGSNTKKRKKKYRGIPDDEPLFVFDSFETDDNDAQTVTADGNNAESTAYTVNDAVSNTDPETVESVVDLGAEENTAEVNDGISDAVSDETSEAVEYSGSIAEDIAAEDGSNTDSIAADENGNDFADEFEEYETELSQTDESDHQNSEIIPSELPLAEKNSEQAFENKKGEQMKFSDLFAELDEYADGDIGSDSGISVIKLSKEGAEHGSTSQSSEIDSIDGRLHGLFPQKRTRRSSTAKDEPDRPNENGINPEPSDAAQGEAFDGIACDPTPELAKDFEYPAEENEVLDIAEEFEGQTVSANLDASPVTDSEEPYENIESEDGNTENEISYAEEDAEDSTEQFAEDEDEYDFEDDGEPTVAQEFDDFNKPIRNILNYDDSEYFDGDFSDDEAFGAITGGSESVIRDNNETYETSPEHDIAYAQDIDESPGFTASSDITAQADIRSESFYERSSDTDEDGVASTLTPESYVTESEQGSSDAKEGIAKNGDSEASGDKTLADETLADETLADETLGSDAPELACEIEEAVSFAEAYETEHSDLGNGDENDIDEPPILADEVDEICLAEELSSTAPEPQDRHIIPEDDYSREISELAAEEAFLRECAQFELPKLSVRSRPISESEDDEADFCVSSGYSYEEADGYDHAAPKRPDDEAKRTARLTRSAKYREKIAYADREILYCAVIAGILMLIEGFGLFFGALEITASASLMLFGFDALLSAISVYVTRDMLADIFRNLKKPTWAIDSIGCLATPLVLVYDLIALFTQALKGGEVKLLGFCAAACALVSAVIRRIKLSQERRSFEIASADGDVSTLAELTKAPAIPEYREFAGMISSSAPIFCISNTDHAEGAYREERNGTGFRPFFAIAACIMAIASTAVGLWSHFGINVGAYESIYRAFSIFLASLPFCIGTAEISARGALTARCASDGAAVDGAMSAERFKDGAVVILRDTDIFPSHSVKVSGYGMAVDNAEERTSGASLERSLCRIASLFERLGGTLSGVISTSESGMSISEDVILTDISERGVSALVDGVYVRIGSAAYLGKYGIAVVADTAEYGHSQRVLYVSDNGMFCTKLILSYTADAELCKRIGKLRSYGAAISVKTYDPCIDPELILTCANLEPELVKIIRYKTSDDRNFDRQEREGNITSHSGAKGLFTALRAAIRYSRAQIPLTVLAAIASLGGMALTLYGALNGSFFSQNTLFIGFYHVICGAVTYIAAKLK